MQLAGLRVQACRADDRDGGERRRSRSCDLREALLRAERLGRRGDGDGARDRGVDVRAVQVGAGARQVFGGRAEVLAWDRNVEGGGGHGVEVGIWRLRCRENWVIGG